MARVGYIIRSYPRLSQTFIVNEILALEQFGVDLHLFPITDPREPIVQAQVAEVRDLLGGLTPAQAGHAYAPGKWTVKEVLGHLTDTERVFSHRALSIARGDPVALPSWEHETWIAPARFGERPMASLLAEWTAVRRATLALLAGLPADTPTRRGTASGNPFSVRALAYVPPGHTIWHLEVLRARYL